MNLALQEILVDSGEVKVCGAEGILRAHAIGSCVVVAGYDASSALGGMAHVMLPGAYHGWFPTLKTKYATDALGELCYLMERQGTSAARFSLCLVGGGNVLGDGHQSPGPDIVRSLEGLLARQGIRPVALEVGGRQRKSCTLHVARGCVMYTVGDSEQRLLWQAAGMALSP
ncbi:MAG: hypothetical protein BWK76_12565 [Desulfobulbaceae bacterium A2]|nr:MAG: hypothetical protein BWK76_12565 [Desulfobulbaceae bacterium A2]